jgi:bifunctional non-homologous end joining protein LigD
MRRRRAPEWVETTPVQFGGGGTAEQVVCTELAVVAWAVNLGDPLEGMRERAGSLEKLLAWVERDEANGLGDAPWPPHFRKIQGEPVRAAPSRRRR